MLPTDSRMKRDDAPWRGCQNHSLAQVNWFAMMTVNRSWSDAIRITYSRR